MRLQQFNRFSAPTRLGEESPLSLRGMRLIVGSKMQHEPNDEDEDAEATLTARFCFHSRIKMHSRLISDIDINQLIIHYHRWDCYETGPPPLWGCGPVQEW